MHNWDVNEAMVIELDSIPTTAIPEIRAMPALSRGSRAGRMAPKKMSRMMRAATTPMTVLDEEVGLVEAAIAPTTLTCRLGEFGARARWTSWVASAAGMLLASWVKLTWAKATVLFALTCLAPAGPYGEVTPDT